MRLILSKIGQHFTEKEIKDMIATVDTDKNGKLSFDGNDVFKKSWNISVHFIIKFFFQTEFKRLMRPTN